VGIMTLPIVCSLSEDALQAVPRSLREGAYACGGTRLDVSLRVVVPAALSGIIASFLLAIARAIGETMIVALAAGGLAQLTADPRDQVQTMTGYMVQIFLGDASAAGVEYRSSYAVAFMLFLMTLVVTIAGYRIMRRYREEYH
jgi:phosphate transport system permease protein